MTILEQQLVTPRTVPWFVVGDASRPETVVFVLHGLGQRARPLADHLGPAAGPDRVLVVPEAPSRYLPRPGAARAGAAWSTGEDHAADLRDNVLYLDALRADVWRRFGARRHVLVGFSQGGLTAARWLAHSRHAWDKVVLWGAPIPRDVDPVGFRAGLGRTELVLAIGDGDPYVTPAAERAALDTLDRLDVPFRVHRYVGGHAILPQPLAEVAA
jgi:predicted esterase